MRYFRANWKEYSVIGLVVTIMVGILLILTILVDGERPVKQETVRPAITVASSATASSTTTVTTLPATTTTVKPISDGCSQGFYDSLMVYEQYRYILTNMQTAGVNQDPILEKQAWDEFEDLADYMGSLWGVLDSECGEYVKQQDRWG